MSGGAASRNLKSVYSSLSNEELPVTISKNNFVSAPFECFNLGKNVHLSRFTVLVSLFASENYNPFSTERDYGKLEKDKG